MARNDHPGKRAAGSGPGRQEGRWNYPDPCEKCTHKICHYYCCEPWLKRFRTIWKQFNSYPARVYRQIQKQKKTEKFVYLHPDEVRRYLEKGPCGKCPKSKVCQTPCAAYWGWWDARMEWIKRRFGDGRKKAAD